MKRSFRFIIVGVLVAVALAVTLVLITRNGGASKPSSEAGPPPTEPALVPIGTLVANVLSQKTPPADFLTSISKPRPAVTRNPEYYTNTVDAAIRRAAQQLTGEAGVVSRVRLNTVAYVQTTAGQALTLFDDSYLRNLASYGMTRDTPVWAFLALGAFRPASWDRAKPSAGTPDALPAMWVVVPQGGYDFALGDPIGKIPDLGTLGKPIEIKRGQAPGTDLDTVRASRPTTPAILVGAPSLAGGKVRVPVSAAGTGFAPYTGLQVHLRWNPAVFTFSALDSTGTVLPSPLCLATILQDADVGGVIVACGSLGGQTTATGLLATIVLTPAATGCSALHLLTYGGADAGTSANGTYTIDAVTNDPQATAYTDGSANVGGQPC